MKTFRKVVTDDYISCVAIGEYGEEISEAEYVKIVDLICAIPIAPDGYKYKLRADSLEWELIMLPPDPPDPDPDLDDSEALEILLGGAE